MVQHFLSLTAAERNSHERLGLQDAVCPPHSFRKQAKPEHRIATSPGLSTLSGTVLKGKVNVLHYRSCQRSDATLCGPLRANSARLLGTTRAGRRGRTARDPSRSLREALCSKAKGTARAPRVQPLGSSSPPARGPPTARGTPRLQPAPAICAPLRRLPSLQPLVISRT